MQQSDLNLKVLKKSEIFRPVIFLRFTIIQLKCIKNQNKNVYMTQ